MIQCANTPELLDYLLWLWYHWNFQYKFSYCTIRMEIIIR